jgi:hypothetical protein
MGLEGSLSALQDPASDPYAEPSELSPHFVVHFNIILLV